MDFYTVKDITDLLSVSERTVRRWIADKKLESIKIGGQIRITKDGLDKFINLNNGGREND
ncbi:helix-turn-helix domain-containing protein [Bacillus cereus]|uniref:Excisionase family DNA binding domain-containing protein n=1 Tax=Bacillus cereus VD184 TaxID=1053242 RepID=A0A9W5VPF5_BACCE|nr:helix-turn-helix domain-containing protein [Bacillus cereus]EOQ01036.1 excisionase family DNA binding domain-containing protein [Bacillus cereus VD184]